MRKPFFRRQTKCWNVKGEDGEFIRLDPDEDKAFKIWEKMGQLAKFDSPDATIDAICEAFLLAIPRKTLSQKRYAKITSLCKSFCLDVGPTMRDRDVSAERDGGQIVKRAIRWAIDSPRPVTWQLP